MCSVIIYAVVNKSIVRWNVQHVVIASYNYNLMLSSYYINNNRRIFAVSDFKTSICLQYVWSKLKKDCCQI